MFRETQARPSPGILMALLLVVTVITAGYLLSDAARSGNGFEAAIGLVILVFACICMPGLFSVAPK